MQASLDFLVPSRGDDGILDRVRPYAEHEDEFAAQPDHVEPALEVDPDAMVGAIRLWIERHRNSGQLILSSAKASTAARSAASATHRQDPRVHRRLEHPLPPFTWTRPQAGSWQRPPEGSDAAHQVYLGCGASSVA